MPPQRPSDPHIFSVSAETAGVLTELFIYHHGAGPFTPGHGLLNLVPDHIAIDSVVFSGLQADREGPGVSIIRHEDNWRFSCSCGAVGKKLCDHQARALYNLVHRKDLRIFFDADLRDSELRKFAEPYGLQDEPDPGQYFTIAHENGSARIRPRSAGILPVTPEQNLGLSAAWMERAGFLPAPEKNRFVVFQQHKYYKHLVIGLYEGETTRAGKPKNPITRADTSALILSGPTADAARFYFGIHRFENNNTGEPSAAGLAELQAILANPLGLPFYMHRPEVSENIVAASIAPMPLGPAVRDFGISVREQDPFYRVSLLPDLSGHQVPAEGISIRFDYFLEAEGRLHLAGSLRLLNLLKFFKQHGDTLLIHRSRFEAFRENFLVRLEKEAEVRYEYLPAATPEQLTEHRLDEPPQLFIYLKDSDPYVEIDPVMKYGDSEIPVLSRKQIYPPGIPRTFIMNRDREAEDRFIALIIRQHPQFAEQASDALPYFYLHKKHFLDEEWFLRTFEEWRQQGIRVMGFNKLKDNRLNPNPAKVTVRVLSGTDWFNAGITVRFGRKKVQLKEVKKAIHNKSKYIPLDDGTLGILPEEWMRRFAEFFKYGDLEDDLLKIPKSNFTVISGLFETEMIDGQVKKELRFLEETLAGFDAVREVRVPAELKATLRDYQKQGLNWLNFLDDFNFGGCLADDMGLGKTIQILAFILSMRNKRPVHQVQTNLLVVPASLIFNWEAEIRKFAPDLKVHILYGANRTSGHEQFADQELVITSYGTLLSDIRHLKKFTFNYVFLDESQNIKNPDSQRYKAACLLRSRNRIVITGTPVENNSFDLFAQLSFANPGLLGSKQYFKDIFLNPVDQFGDRKRALELQRRIRPFILRRTKAQVARELPEKTEMVLYCEMGPRQQAVYDACETEFRDFICSKTQEELPASSVHVLKGLTRLRQICNSPLLLNDDEIHERASAKIDALMEQVLSKAPDHKILIFSQFVSMLDLIGRELTEREIPFSSLTGATRDRARVVREFQEDPGRRVFLISLKAGGTGLNLTQADYIYLVDPWWNPAVENQAIDRAYRIGQHKNVVAVRLICPGTIEEKIMLLQAGKKTLFDDLVRTEPGAGKTFSREELLKLLNMPLA